MQTGVNRLEFAPPSPPGMLRALVLALLVHGLLLAGLTWSVRWKRDTPVLSAEAELWSAIPEEAAPKLVEPPPEPEAPPPPPPKPVPVVEPPAPPPPKVDIALEQEKQRLKKEQARQEELKQEKLRQKLEKERQDKDKLEKARLEKLKQDKLKQEKLKAEQDKLKAEQASKAQQAALDKKKVEQEAKQMEALRNKNMQRMLGLAGASGGDTAKGSARKSSGPSASYGGIVQAWLHPKIVFTDDIQSIQGNPATEVEVKTAPEGTIVSTTITKSSGVKEWDEAVIRAIERGKKLPRDIDGSMPSSLILVFRPKD